MQVISPPLNRCLLLVGADCLAWLAELPRSNLPALPHHSNKLSGQVLPSQKLLYQYKKFLVVWSMVICFLVQSKFAGDLTVLHIPPLCSLFRAINETALPGW